MLRILLIASVVLAALSGEEAAAFARPDPRESSTVVGATLAEPDSPYQAELKFFEFPPNFKRIHSIWYGLRMGRDGTLYVGAGDHFRDSHLYRFDPRTQTIRDLGSVKDGIVGTKTVDQDHGKIHVPPWQAPDGSVWFATHTGGSQKTYGGRLFRYRDDEGIVDLGPMLPDATYYEMWPDEVRGKLYLTTVPQQTDDRRGHFVVYDLASGEWKVHRGVFEGKSPHPTTLADRQGNLYMYNVGPLREDGEGRVLGVTRYDVERDEIETVVGNPCLWSGAATPDNEVGYVIGYRTGLLYRFRFADWPLLEFEQLGSIDPQERTVSTHNLAVTPDRRLLLVAGHTKTEAGTVHGIWGYELATGTRIFIADYTELITLSTGRKMKRRDAYLSSTMFAVAPDGWYYLGVNGGGDLGLGHETQVRLLAVRVTPKAPAAE